MHRIKQIADHYGYDSQSMIAIEEMSELTKEILKLRRYTCDPEIPMDIVDKHVATKIAEEIADVLIMIDQLVYLYGVGLEVEMYREEKLKRQLRRIEDEKKKTY